MLADPHDHIIRVAKFRKVTEDEELLFSLNRHLAVFDAGKTARVDNEFPIVFIVGLPRSGTTLLSQLVSRHLRVGYINNLIARFWLNPLVGIAVSRAVLGQNPGEKINLESKHGVTEEPWGPHEFGYFWRHWLHLDECETHHLDKEVASGLEREDLKKVLLQIASAFQRPVVFKNIICGLNASLLSGIYPKSLFIHIQRDTKTIVASILTARLERYGSYSAWWSLKPSSYASIAAETDPIRQVVRQVMEAGVELRRELSTPNVAMLEVSYETVCRQPLQILLQIADAIKDMGVQMELPSETIAPLKASPGPTLPVEMDRALKSLLEEPKV